MGSKEKPPSGEGHCEMDGAVEGLANTLRRIRGLLSTFSVRFTDWVLCMLTIPFKVCKSNLSYMMSVRVPAGNTVPSGGFSKEAWKVRLLSEAKEGPGGHSEWWTWRPPESSSRRPEILPLRPEVEGVSPAPCSTQRSELPHGSRHHQWPCWWRVAQKQEDQEENPASLLCFSRFSWLPSAGLKQLEGGWQKGSARLQSPEQGTGDVGQGKCREVETVTQSAALVCSGKLLGPVSPFSFYQGSSSLYNVRHVRSGKWDLTVIFKHCLIAWAWPDACTY